MNTFGILYGIGVVIFTIVVIVANLDSEYEQIVDLNNFNLKTPKSLIILNIICIFSVILFIMSIFMTGFKPWERDSKPYSTEYIIALNDNNQVHGRSYLMSGYINEELYYQYIVDLGNGEYTTNQIKASDVTISYDTKNYRDYLNCH